MLLHLPGRQPGTQKATNLQVNVGLRSGTHRRQVAMRVAGAIDRRLLVRVKLVRVLDLMNLWRNHPSDHENGQQEERADSVHLMHRLTERVSSEGK